VLELAERVSKIFNQNAASDLAVARSLARTGAEGCLENVEVNLPGVKDEQARAEFETRSKELRSVYTVLAGGTDG
jgi:formiminotetrahydrofolate cyclodeaminase